MKENMNPKRHQIERSPARRAPVAVAAAAFQENVWRRIEEAEAPAKSGSWLERFAALVLRPRFAYATVATLMLAGVLLGTYQGAQTVKQTEQARYLAAVAPNSLR